MQFTQLYKELMTLTVNTEAFFYSDHELDGVTYRIFNYRLASFTEFNMPSALECRGIMFEIQNEQPVRIAARPMEKFFNLYENPFTSDLNLSNDNVQHIQIKADGSLMSSFIHNGEVKFKSKGSLTSDQAVWANKWYETRSKELRDEIKQVASKDITLNFEYVAPHNRIVLNYDSEYMILLNARHNYTGEYIDLDWLSEDYTLLSELVVPSALDIYEDDTPESLIADAPSLTDIEGFVVRLKCGLHFKLKTEWYLVQHRAKDHVDSPKRLFEAAILETTDDLKSLFHDNPMVIERIEQMERKAAHIYNHAIATVEDFVNNNLNLIQNDQRKEFALLGQERFTGSEKRFFGLAMQEYNARRGNGTPPNYKEFCIKHSKDWGINDEPSTNDL